MELEHVRSEIEHMRVQAGAPAQGSLQLEGRYPTASAEALLQRMLDKIDGLCAERDRLRAELPKPRRCWGAEVGEAFPGRPRPTPVHQSAGRAPAIGDPGRVVLPARPGNHRGDRPIRREGVRQPVLLPQQALQHWWWQEGSRPLIVLKIGKIAQRCPLSAGFFCELSYCPKSIQIGWFIKPQLATLKPEGS